MKKRVYGLLMMAFLTMGAIGAIAPSVNADIDLKPVDGTMTVTDGPLNVYHTAWLKVLRFHFDSIKPQGK